MKIIILLTVLFTFVFSAKAWDKSDLWAHKWRVSDTIADTIKEKDKIFEYLIIQKNISEGDKHEMDTRVEKDTVYFKICNNRTACAYYYKLEKTNDSIKVLRECDPETMEQHIASYCVYCKVYGLRKGIYFINIGKGYKKITIK
jgi:hypothetical protein